MAELGTDILHQILIRLDAADLVRYKSVCKLWQSVISDQRFVSTHLNYSYTKNSINEHSQRTRIVMSKRQCEYRQNNYRGTHFVSCYFQLLGSANGLICIYIVNIEVLVVNLLTGEVRKVPKPLIIDIGSPFCWGFGYDSLTDDYKVVLGLRASEGVTCYQVFNLKSNVWRFIGELKYTGVTTIGTFCNGALHWFMNDENKKIILSFDLSKEKFKEIPQPDDIARYKCSYYGGLTVIQGNLGILGCKNPPYPKWVMKNYNVKESWEFKSFVRKRDDYVARHLKDRVQYKSSCGDVRIWFSLSSDDISAPIYMPSLVSPHAQGRLERKRNREEMNDTREQR